MTLEELLTKNRSFRRFHQDQPLDEKTLVGLVELARLCPSAANRQPLKYMISWEPERNAEIFAHLRWAAALAPWPGPAEGERPTGSATTASPPRACSWALPNRDWAAA